MVKDICKQIAEDFGIEWTSTLTSPLFGTTATGKAKKITPDGGVFRVNGKVLIVEAKHQGKAGNAIERWYQNHAWASLEEQKCGYLTFGSGYIDTDGALYQTLFPFHSGKHGAIGTPAPGANTLYLREEMTGEFIRTKVLGVLMCSMMLVGDMSVENQAELNQIAHVE